jgi:hypothetical protein
MWISRSQQGSFLKRGARHATPSEIIRVRGCHHTLIPGNSHVRSRGPAARPTGERVSACCWLISQRGCADGIQFFVGQNLFASGDITVGSDVANTVTTPTDVAVQGTVVDSNSKKPINGAVVIVLKPNLDITNYLLFGAKSDQVAYAKTNSKGEFTLDNRVSVDVGYPWIIGAKGYRSIPDPVFTITQQLATDPYSMTISLDSAR